MVAAHNSDLAAAQQCGLRTAFIARPTQHGPNQTTDLCAEGDWDAVLNDFDALAETVDVDVREFAMETATFFKAIERTR